MYCLELAGEDDPFAAREAESAAGGVERVAPGLATARSVSVDRARTLAYTRAVGRVVGRTGADVASARALAAAAPLDRTGTVAVRARDVRGLTGTSTRAAERELGRVLVERGFEIDLDDPDHELRVLFSAGDPAELPGPALPDANAEADAGGGDAREGICLLHWLEAESVRDFGARKPTDRPFFQPGSMDPLDARAMANIAGAAPGRTVVDPMCGTGGLLIEAGLVGAAPVGLDAQAKMVGGARENLRAYVDGGGEVIRGDATALPIRDGAADGVAFDAPYGRQSKIARHDLRDLIAGALSEAARIAPRGVMVADRDWSDAARDAGWAVESRFERRVHRSLVRHVHVLERACAGEDSCSSPNV